jgi:hypothetical protein
MSPCRFPISRRKIKEEIHLEYTLSISSSRRKLQPQKLVIVGDTKRVSGVLKVFSPAERENSTPNEKNSGLGEERSPLYLRGERL